MSFVGDIATAPEAQAQRADIQREAGLIAGLPFSQADWDRAKTAALFEAAGIPLKDAPEPPPSPPQTPTAPTPTEAPAP